MCSRCSASTAHCQLGPNLRSSQTSKTFFLPTQAPSNNTEEVKRTISPQPEAHPIVGELMDSEEAQDMEAAAAAAARRSMEAAPNLAVPREEEEKEGKPEAELEDREEKEEKGPRKGIFARVVGRVSGGVSPVAKSESTVEVAPAAETEATPAPKEAAPPPEPAPTPEEKGAIKADAKQPEQAPEPSPGVATREVDLADVAAAEVGGGS